METGMHKAPSESEGAPIVHGQGKHRTPPEWHLLNMAGLAVRTWVYRLFVPSRGRPEVGGGGGELHRRADGRSWIMIHRAAVVIL